MRTFVAYAAFAATTVLLTLLPTLANANALAPLVDQIRQGNLSLRDLEALTALDQTRAGVGYALCVAAGGAPSGALNRCTDDGSVGYGLCVIGGGEPSGSIDRCADRGSVGYGLCVLAGGAPASGGRRCSN